jgi:glutamate-1-semialdehyde 2,1-aminomutase
MLPLAERLAGQLRAVIAGNGLDWHVTQIGSRGEFVCAPTPAHNGTEAREKMHGTLEHALHLYLINRGVLIAPFHNMTLVSPATTQTQVDRLADVLDQGLKTLTGRQS